MAVRTAWTPTAVPGEVMSAADAKSIPGGWIGWAKTEANQTGISAETDLTGLTVSVTVGADRLIRITVESIISRSVADGVTIGNIKQDGVTVGRWAQHAPSAATEFDVANGFVILSAPSAGAHTYKATLQRFSGTGTVSSAAAAGSPAFIVVEDLGPS